MKLVFAQRFLDRVEETFINENKHHKFTEFLSILRNFSENQHQQTGAHLYLVRNETVSQNQMMISKETFLFSRQEMILFPSTLTLIILCSFLFQMLEKFFMPDYPDLVDLFLYFLMPSDAVEINKSMDYFLKVNFSKFLNKLNIFFQKQPAQVRHCPEFFHL